jgi:hypothetical protein
MTQQQGRNLGLTLESASVRVANGGTPRIAKRIPMFEKSGKCYADWRVKKGACRPCGSRLRRCRTAAKNLANPAHADKRSNHGGQEGKATATATAMPAADAAPATQDKLKEMAKRFSADAHL